MTSHYACKKCGLQECICFVEDIPEAPYYYDKYCVVGQYYEVTKGQDYKVTNIYQLHNTRWYNSIEEANTARANMIKQEVARLERRLAWLKTVTKP